MLNEFFRSFLEMLTVDQASLRAIFPEALWSVFRDVYLVDKTLMAIVVCLVLERLVHLYHRRLVTPNFVLDLSFPLFNAAVLGGLAAWATAAIENLYLLIPGIGSRLLDSYPGWVQAGAVFLAGDLMNYWSHRLRHEVKPFWHFHAIHHSQRDLNPATTFRNHPGERIPSTLIRYAPLAFLGGSPTTAFWYVMLNNFWGFFIHSNVRVNLGPLKSVIVTPQFHRIHHSLRREHWDKNYGERLVLWDWMFGSLYVASDDEYPETGVDGLDFADPAGYRPSEILRSWGRMMLYPFRKLASP